MNGNSAESTAVQRHHKLYQRPDVIAQGRLVTTWWRLHYLQYAWLSIFGVLCRVSDRRGNLTRGKMAKWSESYVLAFLAASIALFSISRVATGELAHVLVLSSLIAGGYRVYEIVFAQSYYLLQSQSNNVTSFTRTLLFQVIFVVEISLHGANIALHYSDAGIWPALAFSFQSLTLQANFLDPPFSAPTLVQVVYGGCSVVGLVILLGSLPMVISAASRVLGEER